MQILQELLIEWEGTLRKFLYVWSVRIRCEPCCDGPEKPESRSFCLLYVEQVLERLVHSTQMILSRGSRSLPPS